jgi:hypothetical protein
VKRAVAEILWIVAGISAAAAHVPIAEFELFPIFSNGYVGWKRIIA